MNWLNKLERKFGRYAIKNLMMYIVGINLVVFLLMMIDQNGTLINLLEIDRGLIFKGQIWRLITYIFIPNDTNIVWVIFTLYLYYILGNALEQEWGSFKFNIFYLIGIIATTFVSLVTDSYATGSFINSSLFLAFAYIYPEYELLLFFFIPVKVKYLAWLDWIFIAGTVILSPISLKISAICSVINYFIFFGKDIVYDFSSRSKNLNRKRNYKKAFTMRVEKKTTMHKCTICGATEKDNPDLEFRYCAKCDGLHEYCNNHLFTHTHIKK